MDGYKLRQEAAKHLARSKAFKLGGADYEAIVYRQSAQALIQAAVLLEEIEGMKQGQLNG